MEVLDREDKTVSVTFLITPTLNKRINKLMKKRNWQKSAFIRVAIEQALDRIAKGEK